MTSPVQPPVGPENREPLLFLVFSSVRFLKPWCLLSINKEFGFKSRLQQKLIIILT